MSKSYSGIYCWTSPSGKKYVGQATNLSERKRAFLNFNCSYSSEKSKIEMARKKYNKKSQWKYEILESCERRLLNEREMYWIEKFSTFDSGYNSTIGGDGVSGIKFSEETRKVMSESKIEYFKTHDSPLKGKKMPEYVKEAIRIGMERFLMENGGGHMKGKHHSEETKKKISETKKKFFEENPEECEKQSDRLKSYYKNNPDVLFEKSNKMKERFKNGVVRSGKNAGKTYREAASESTKKWIEEHGHPMQGKKQTEGSRKKMSQSKTGKPLLKSRIPIIQLNLDGSFVREWDCAKSAEENNSKFLRSKICLVCKGERKTCGGYIWMYKEDYDRIIGEIRNNSI